MFNLNINPGQTKNLTITPVDANGNPGSFDSASNPAFSWAPAPPFTITPNPNPGGGLVNGQKAAISAPSNVAPGVYNGLVSFGVGGGPVQVPFTITVPMQPATTATFTES